MWHLIVLYHLLLAVAVNGNETPQISPAERPSLTIRVTTDLTISCDMSVFDIKSKPHRVNNVNISVTLNGGKEIRLATLESSQKPLSYSYLNAESGRVYSVSGRLYSDPTSKDDMLKSWLNVSVADVSPDDCGVYKCVIDYTEKSADSASTYKTYALNFIALTSVRSDISSEPMPARHVGSLALILKKGLNARCEYIYKHDDLPVTSVQFTKEGSVLAKSRVDEPDSCGSTALRCDTVHSFDGYTGQLVHVYDILSEDDQKEFQCSVEKPGSTVTSSPQRLHINGLPGSDGISADTRIPVWLVVCISLIPEVIIILAVGIVSWHCFLKRRKKKYRKPNRD